MLVRGKRREKGRESRSDGERGRAVERVGGAEGERKRDEDMDERQMNESLHERNSYRIRETPYEVPATRATRRLIGIRLCQSKQGFL